MRPEQPLPATGRTSLADAPTSWPGSSPPLRVPVTKSNTLSAILLRGRPTLLGPVILLGAMILPRTLEAQGSDPEGVRLLEATSDRYAGLSTMCAGFRQELVATLLRRTVRSHGQFCQDYPDRFSIRFEDPEGDLVVGDGEWVWLYYPSTDPRQVIRSSMDGAAERFDFLRGFLQGAAERYEVQVEAPEEVGGVEARVLALTPRSTAAFVRAWLWIDSDRNLILQVRTEEENGSVRTVTLENVRLNPDIPEGTFSFVPPEGADVITRGP